MDYESMTIEQLDTEIQRITEQRAVLKQKAETITAIRDRKVIAEKAALMAASLSNEERAALAQVISGAGAITSGEVVNGF